jgi:hypothetical protein
MPGSAFRFQPIYPHVGSRVLSYRAVNDMMRGRQEQMASQKSMSAGVMRDVPLQPALALVRNDSGGDVDRGGVLALSDLVFDEEDNEDAFWTQQLWTGTKPQRNYDDNDFSAIGVAVEPIPEDEIGLVAVSGLVPVLVTIGSTAHRYADIADNSSAGLQSQEWGPYRILRQPGSTGSGKKCLVLLGPNTEERTLLVHPDADIAVGASGTCSVYQGTKGAEADTGRNVTVFARFVAVDSGSEQHAVWIDNGYEFNAGDCPES